MKKITCVCIVWFTFLAVACYSQSPVPLVHLKLDSALRQLSLKKNIRDSTLVMQKIADASFPLDDYTRLCSKPDYIALFLEWNKRAKVTNPYPYELAEKAAGYIRDKQLDQALQVMKQVISEFDKQHKVINPQLIFIRLLFNKLNDQEGKSLYFKQKLEYYQVNGPVENTAPCYHGIAGYYAYKAAHNQAINNYLKAAEIYRKFSAEFYANEMVVVANVYSKWGNLTRSAYYLDSLALPLILRMNDSVHISFAYDIKSIVSMRRHQYNKALNELNAAMRYEVNGSPSYIRYLVQKGLVLLELKQPSTALVLFKRAKMVVDSAGFHVDNTSGYIEIDYGFYKYYQLEGNSTEAEKYLLTAYRKVSDEKTFTLELQYLKELGAFYSGLGKTEQAARYLNQYLALEEQTEKDLGQFKMAQFEIDKNDQQQREHISQLKQEKAVQDYQLSRRNTLLVVSFAVILLVIFLLGFIYKQLVVNKKTLTSLRQTQRQLIQSEKMASLGELTAGIAHEIQNPLNFVNNFSDVNRELIDEMQMAIERGDLEEAKEIAIDIQENEKKVNMHGKRADGIVKGMLQHSRASSDQKEPTDLNVLADEYLRLAYHGLRAKDKNFNADLVTHFDENLPMADMVPQDVGRVVLNIINNAFYATQQKAKTAGSAYKPMVEVATSTGNGQVVVKIKDNGTGMPDTVREKIMQPFFTTKPTGEGTGLGLSLSYDIIVKGHGGKIDVNSKEGEYTEFTVTLPI